MFVPWRGNSGLIFTGVLMSACCSSWSQLQHAFSERPVSNSEWPKHATATSLALPWKRCGVWRCASYYSYQWKSRDAGNNHSTGRRTARKIYDIFAWWTTTSSVGTKTAAEQTEIETATLVLPSVKAYNTKIVNHWWPFLRYKRRYIIESMA